MWGLGCTVRLRDPSARFRLRASSGLRVWRYRGLEFRVLRVLGFSG